MSDLAYPIKLDDDYPCRGRDALGELQTFNDLLEEGMEVGPELDGDVFPTGEVILKEDGLWVVAEGTAPSRRLCPIEDCRTELTAINGRRRGSVQWWCWKCERYWKAGVREEASQP